LGELSSEIFSVFLFFYQAFGAGGENDGHFVQALVGGHVGGVGGVHGDSLDSHISVIHILRRCWEWPLPTCLHPACCIGVAVEEKRSASSQDDLQLLHGGDL
jgi:hypothetical protein